MQEVPDDVFKQHIFPHLGVLDKVALSGVNKRFYSLLGYISKKWNSYDEPFTEAVRLNDVALAQRLQSRTTLERETYRGLFLGACALGHIDMVWYLNSIAGAPPVKPAPSLNSALVLHRHGFSAAVYAYRYELMDKMIDWGWFDPRSFYVKHNVYFDSDWV